MSNTPAPQMQTPTGAIDWERYPREEDQDEESAERWTAVIPNTIDRLLAVEEREPGAWIIEPGEPDNTLPCAPPLPAGPFGSAQEAMAAGDAWCAKWAPRRLDLPGLFSARVCPDGKIRLSPARSTRPSDQALTPAQARALAEALLALAAEMDEQAPGPAGGHQ